jgi:hypothetical protein
MKYYEPYAKIVDSQKNEYFVSKSQLEAILEMPAGSIVKITDPDGVWRMKTINRSFIVSTEDAGEEVAVKKLYEKLQSVSNEQIKAEMFAEVRGILSNSKTAISII